MVNQIDRFLDVMMRSGLVTLVQLVAACNGFDVLRGDESALDDLCRHLVGKGLVTDWQCEKLRMGKFKGFFLDGYCLVRHLRKDETSALYLCREVATGKCMAIRVTPPTHAQDGKFHYELEEPPADSPRSE
jgi:eukaryotic-like serine/threonine-protein kinase